MANDIFPGKANPDMSDRELLEIFPISRIKMNKGLKPCPFCGDSYISCRKRYSIATIIERYTRNSLDMR